MHVEDLAKRNVEFFAGVARQMCIRDSNMPIGSDKNRPGVIGTGEISPRALRIFAVRIWSATYGQTPYSELPMTIDALNGVKPSSPRLRLHQQRHAVVGDHVMNRKHHPIAPDPEMRKPCSRPCCRLIVDNGVDRLRCTASFGEDGAILIDETEIEAEKMIVLGLSRNPSNELQTCLLAALVIRVKQSGLLERLSHETVDQGSLPSEWQQAERD